MDALRQAAGVSNGAVVRTHWIGAFHLVESDYSPSMRMPRHAHSQAIISLIVSGGTEERFRDTSDRYGPGWVSVKPWEVDHSNLVCPVGMRGFAVSRSCDDAEDAADWDAALSRYQWRSDRTVVRAMFGVYRALREPAGPDGAVCLEERLVDLLAALAPGPLGFAKPRSWLSAVRDQLHHRAEGGAANGQLAVQAGVHPVYLARAFRRQYGCSMSTYLHRLRVRRVADMLADRGLSAARIALDAGFADQAHCCRIFKAEFGMTPGMYRRLLRA